MHDRSDSDDAGRADSEVDTSPGLPPVQHCPFCGESVGSFWGRREADGSTWCESCATFFRVQVV